MFYILFIKKAVGEKNKSLRKGDTNKLVQKICGKRREQAPRAINKFFTYRLRAMSYAAGFLFE